MCTLQSVDLVPNHDIHMFRQKLMPILYWPFPTNIAAFGLNVLVPMDPRESFMMVLQAIPELSTIFALRMHKEGRSIIYIQTIMLHVSPNIPL